MIHKIWPPGLADDRPDPDHRRLGSLAAMGSTPERHP